MLKTLGYTVTTVVSVSLGVFLALTLLGRPCLAQSTVIDIGCPGARSSSPVPVSQSAVPITLSQSQEKMWAVLNTRAPGAFGGVRTVADLVMCLRRLGLPAELDQSAIDDSLAADLPLEMSRIGGTVLDVLIISLDRHNGTIAMPGDRFLIISKDVANEPELMTLFQYDVTALGLSAYELSDTILTMIAPDEWDVTAGDGSMNFRSIGNRKLLLVAQRLPVQRQLLRMLTNLQKSNGLAGAANIAGKRIGSSVIRFDAIYQRTMQQKLGGQGRGFGGGGVGGYGLGGGVF